MKYAYSAKIGDFLTPSQPEANTFKVHHLTIKSSHEKEKLQNA